MHNMPPNDKVAFLKPFLAIFDSADELKAEIARYEKVRDEAAASVGGAAKIKKAEAVRAEADAILAAAKSDAVEIVRQAEKRAADIDAAAEAVRTAVNDYSVRTRAECDGERRVLADRKTALEAAEAVLVERVAAVEKREAEAAAMLDQANAKMNDALNKMAALKQAMGD